MHHEDAPRRAQLTERLIYAERANGHPRRPSVAIRMALWLFIFVPISVASQICFLTWVMHPRGQALLIADLEGAGVSGDAPPQSKNPPPSSPVSFYVIPKTCLCIMIAAAVVGGAITFGIATLLLGAMGLTPLGPAACSTAAGMQAAGAATGMPALFSTLQSAAMGGSGIWLLITTGVASGPVLAAAAYAFCRRACGGDCG